MWTVKSESGTLHAVLVQDSVEQFWEKRLPFVGIESSDFYLSRCPHASFDGGHEQWEQLPRYLREEGVQTFELTSILEKILDRSSKEERLQMIEEIWKDSQKRPDADELTVENLFLGHPSEPYYEAKSDRVILPDFMRVAWPYTRDTSFTTQVGTIICSMRRYSRRFEPCVVKLAYEYDSVLCEKMDIIWDANEKTEPNMEPLCIEGGDAQIIDEETVAIGVGQRSTFTGFMKTAMRLFERDIDKEIKYICAVTNPDYPAIDYMHLDVVINYPDRGTALVMPYYFDSEVVKDMPKKKLLLKTLKAVRERSELGDRIMEPLVHPNDFIDAGGCSVYVRDGNRPKLERRELSLVDFLVKEGKLDEDGIIYVGGKSETDNDVKHMMVALMEQARGASNIVTIKPRLVVAYKRNKKTNEALKEHGIKVKEWDDCYLDMLGGPHCSTSPLSRSGN